MNNVCNNICKECKYFLPVIREVGRCKKYNDIVNASSSACVRFIEIPDLEGERVERRDW